MTDLRLNLICLFQEEIRSSLTIGREDNDLEPFSKAQIQDFLHQHQAQIDRSVTDLITNFPANELRHPEGDLIRESLYEWFDPRDV